MVGGALSWIAVLLGIVVLAAGLRAVAPVAVKPMLLGVSIVFYWQVSDGNALPLAAVFGAHAMAVLLCARRPGWVILAVIINLAPLAYFKVAQGNEIPLGLSFLTFLQISALLDIRSGAERLKTLDLILYALFFGTVTAWPITRYNTLAPQIARLGYDKVEWETILRGGALAVFGLCKISIIGQPIQQAIDPILASVYSGVDLTSVEAAYVFFGGFLALYFLFSGYSDIAVGTGLMLGLRLALNFNSPFKATNPSDFIDRWHMSLTLWVKTYVFDPVVRFFRRQKRWSVERRSIIGWAAGSFLSLLSIGAWHSVEPAFLLSGAVGGVLVVAIGLRQASPRARAPLPRPVARALLIAVTLVMTMIYQLPDLSDVAGLMSTMIDPARFQVGEQTAGWLPAGLGQSLPQGAMMPTLTGGAALPLAWLVGAWGIALFAPNSNQIFGLIEAKEARWWHWRPNALWGLGLGLAGAAAVGMLLVVRVDGVGYDGF